jgi:hypothetical protein
MLAKKKMKRKLTVFPRAFRGTRNIMI